LAITHEGPLNLIIAEGKRVQLDTKKAVVADTAGGISAVNAPSTVGASLAYTLPEKKLLIGE
jgi:hypothetical protein